MKWEGRVAEPEGVAVFDVDGVTHYVELKKFADYWAIESYVNDQVRRRMQGKAAILRSWANELEDKE